MKTGRLCRGDWVILAVAALLAGMCCVQIWRPRAAGDTVVVLTPNGEQRYALAQDRIVSVQGNGGIRLTVEIADGRVRVRESECPDKVCVHGGWLSQSGQTTACVPAGVSVRVVGTTPQVDGVTA